MKDSAAKLDLGPHTGFGFGVGLEVLAGSHSVGNSKKERVVSRCKMYTREKEWFGRGTR